MPQYEHAEALAAEKRGAEQRFEIGPENDDVVEARRHGPKRQAP